MDENANIENAFDKLSEMLSSEEGQNRISDIISMLSGGESRADEKGEDFSSAEDDASSSAFNPNVLKAINKMMSGKRNNNQNAAFLEALKPFLKEKRRKKLSDAVNILNAASVIKELGLFNKGGE